jgi:hypothetical protein
MAPDKLAPRPRSESGNMLGTPGSLLPSQYLGTAQGLFNKPR